MIRSGLFSLLVLASQLPLQAATPLLAPPPVVQRQGQALLNGAALCPALQTALESAVGTEERAWSVSILDQRGQLLADLNGGFPGFLHRIRSWSARLLHLIASDPTSG